MAKYMLIMRSTDEVAAQYENMDFEELLNTMGKFNDELIRAGILVAAEGLDDVVVLVGGIIPDEDVPTLREMGVSAVFGPGTNTADTIGHIRDAVASSSTPSA